MKNKKLKIVLIFTYESLTKNINYKMKQEKKKQKKFGINVFSKRNVIICLNKLQLIRNEQKI